MNLFVTCLNSVAATLSDPWRHFSFWTSRCFWSRLCCHSQANWDNESQNTKQWDFLVVKTPHSQCRGHRFHPWSGNQDPTCHWVSPKTKSKPNKNPPSNVPAMWCWWCSSVAKSHPALCNPMGFSLSGSFVYGIFQARVLEWAAISFSRGSSWPRDSTQVSHTLGSALPYEPPGKSK